MPPPSRTVSPKRSCLDRVSSSILDHDVRDEFGPWTRLDASEPAGFGTGAQPDAPLARQALEVFHLRVAFHGDQPCDRLTPTVADRDAGSVRYRAEIRTQVCTELPDPD